ncbi:hypothetical protein N0O92_01380 [Alkalihalobacillus sp. MEB130]|uniref:hypothetical protein n=1 Tax=Alkalihalobacillus sp. MEB130 TaxID=2976704 RepID=UPI0028DE534B|nr:hypothetical protein [Alkalihalobacillus sp. MEB130]MDT8858862.1 hypothetical protein [Alkalihalobacillus sp. MEB130]
MTVALYDQQIENGTVWDGEQGWMIAAPAATRAEALHISNALMKGFLPEPLE